MQDPSPSNLKGALYALLAFALFATHDVGVKTLGAHYAPFQIIFFSVLFGLPIATLMLMRDPVEGHLRPVHPWWTALRTGAAVLTGFSAFHAFATLPLAQVYAILFASPLLITVLSIPILGERVGPHRWFAVVLGLIGVLVAVRPGAETLELGHAAAIVAAFGSALVSVIVRKIGSDERSAVLMLYPMMANLVVMAVILPFVYKPMPIEHLGISAAMSALAFVAALLVIAAYRAAVAAVVAPMQYSQIIWAAVFGALLFGETPDTWTLTGAGIVILSGLYIVLREARSGRSKHAPVSTGKGRYEAGTTPRLFFFLRRRNDR